MAPITIASTMFTDAPAAVAPIPSAEALTGPTETIDMSFLRLSGRHKHLLRVFKLVSIASPREAIFIRSGGYSTPFVLTFEGDDPP